MSTPLHVRTLSGTQTLDMVRGQGYFPVIADLGDGHLIVVHRGGSGHMGLGGRLDVCHSEDWGATWSEPATIADSERDDRNPALGIAADGTVILAYHWQGNYDEKGQWKPELGRQDTRTVRSSDGGRTWHDDALINFQPINGASPFGKIRNIGRDMYMPIYGGQPSDPDSKAIQVAPAGTPTYLIRSSDNGISWGDPIHVADGLNEADLLVLPNGDFLFAARSEAREEMAIHTCKSSDGGSSWRYLGPVTQGSEHPPDLTLLGNGWILMTFGHRHEPFGVQGMISRDGGETWDERRIIIDDKLPGGDTGYPSTVLQSDGSLVTVYYTAGTWEKRWDTYNPLDAACRVVSYRAQDLIDLL